MSQTDEALLRAWRDGDGEAGNALFERYFDALVPNAGGRG